MKCPRHKTEMENWGMTSTGKEYFWCRECKELYEKEKKEKIINMIRMKGRDE